MSLGKINVEMACDKANEIRTSAEIMDTILKAVNEKMLLIDDEETQLDTGSLSASAAKAEFAGIMQKFPSFYAQVMQYAADIDKVAETMKNQ